MSKFEVYVVPVPPEGNWLYKEEKKVYETDDREAADEWIYFTNADEPAPDKHDFRRYEIRENP
jgi:hypothetical protein